MCVRVYECTYACMHAHVCVCVFVCVCVCSCVCLCACSFVRLCVGVSAFGVCVFYYLRACLLVQPVVCVFVGFYVRKYAGICMLACISMLCTDLCACKHE